MALIRVCDICGFKLKPEEKQFMFEYRMKKRIPVFSLDFGLDHQWEKVDICQKCANRLIEHIRHEVKEENRHGSNSFKRERGST